MFSVYAITADGRTLKGSSDVESAADALAKVHKLASSKGLSIVKATVRKLDDDDSFKVSEPKKAKDAAASGAAKPAGKPAKR